MNNNLNRFLLVLALGCSVAALLLSLVPKNGESEDDQALQRIEALEQEIAHLRGGIYQVRDSNGSANGSNSVPEIVYLENDDEMSRSVDGMASEMEDMRWTMTLRGMMPATDEHIRRSKDIISDANQGDRDKLGALRVLRRSGDLDDDLVKKMIGVFDESENQWIRSEILNNLDGMKTPELVPTLLKASAESESPRVRREAIDAMSGFLPDPDLEEWLQIVNESDKSKRVRREAQRLLNKHATPKVN